MNSGHNKSAHAPVSPTVSTTLRYGMGASMIAQYTAPGARRKGGRDKILQGIERVPGAITSGSERGRMNNNKVEIRYRGAVHHVESGIRIDDFLRSINGEIADTVLSALVNRRQVMLDFPLRGEVDLELVSFGDREGESVYKRSVCLMFYEACHQLYPGVRTVIGQSLGNCYHYQLRGDQPDLEEIAPAIEKMMIELYWKSARSGAKR